jgi:glycosyltransferase involved in cell wall biosynthesis
MLKIAYSLLWRASWGSGILKKVLSQASTWHAVGHDVRIFMISYSPEAADAARALAPGLPVSVLPCRSAADRFRQYMQLTRQIAAWGPDVIYHRFAGFYPGLAGLARRFPMVVEVNTNDASEYRISRPYRGWYNQLTRGLLLAQVRGMVFVSGELAELPSYARFGKPSLVTGNGIDLSQFQPLPPADNQQPRLVFIGSQHESWHGVDKIMSLAARCPEWQLDVIGIDTLGQDVPASPNVMFHGYVDRPRYEPLFARADAAIGTLALHRKRMEEASPLKVREYLAFGLPTIIGYCDTDFVQPPPTILQIPNTEDNVQTHLEEIRRFVERVRGTRVPRADVAHLDVRQKEQRRLEFLSRVAGRETYRSSTGEYRAD